MEEVLLDVAACAVNVARTAQLVYPVEPHDDLRPLFDASGHAKFMGRVLSQGVLPRNVNRPSTDPARSLR